MLDQKQLRSLIIQPVLHAMSLYSIEAEDLLVGTCAEETGGTFLIQKTDEDPYLSMKQNTFALGIYQMEPRTHNDIWKNYMPSHPKIVNDLMQVCMFSKKPDSSMLVYNLYYATAMARVFYLRCNEPIPATLELQSIYYKTYWNTSEGKSTPQQYVLNYNNFMNVKVPAQKGVKNVQSS
jgi:hypothetical protein